MMEDDHLFADIRGTFVLDYEEIIDPYTMVYD